MADLLGRCYPSGLSVDGLVPFGRRHRRELYSNKAGLHVHHHSLITTSLIALTLAHECHDHGRYGTAVIVLSSLDGSGSETKVTDAYYSSNMIILSVALGLVVLMAGIFVYRLHSALTRGGRTWRKLQPYLLWDAGVVASLTTLDLCCVVTAYALYVAAECFPSQTALVVLGFVRMMTFTGVVAWMTSTATLMQVISYDESTHADDGSAHADDDPTTATGDTTETTGKKTTGTFKVRLMVDEPISVILRKRYVWILSVTGQVARELATLLAALARTQSLDHKHINHKCLPGGMSRHSTGYFRWLRLW